MFDNRCQKKRFARFVIALLMVGLSMASASAQPSAPDDTQFRAQLRSLKKSRKSAANPNQIINAYEQMIENYSDHPQVAEAMYDLAKFYILKDIGGGKSTSWFRRAVEATQGKSPEKVGSVWNRSRFSLARHLRATRNNDKAIRESRSLLEAISVKFPEEDSLMRIHIMSEFVMQYVVEGNFLGAEQHCRELLDWKKPDEDTQMHPREPMDPRTRVHPMEKAMEQKIIQGHQTLAVECLMQKLPYGPGTKKGKTAWLKRFSEDYIDHQWLQEAIKPIYHELAETEDPPPPTPALELTSPKEGSGRTVFLAFNFIVVLVLGVLVFRNRILNRREASNAL